MTHDNDSFSEKSLKFKLIYFYIPAASNVLFVLPVISHIVTAGLE